MLRAVVLMTAMGKGVEVAKLVMGPVSQHVEPHEEFSLGTVPFELK